MPRTSDYGGFGSLLDLAAAERASELASEPLDCPNDGTPLWRTQTGRLYCPFDGWEPDFA